MNVNEFIAKAKETVFEGWIIVALTDDYIVDRFPISAEKLKDNDDKVLEIRVFNQQREELLSRADIGKEFMYKAIIDEGDDRDTRDHYDEVQFLDIDTESSSKHAESGKVTATGGGEYNLPLNKINDAGVRIRYYLEQYEETGQARVADWRVVELVEGK